MTEENNDNEEDFLDECYLCEEEEVPHVDRWYFCNDAPCSHHPRLEQTWLCRSCYSKFETIEQFNEFKEDPTRVLMYGACASIQRLLIMDDISYDDILEIDVDFLKDAMKKHIMEALNVKETRLKASLEVRLKKIREQE
jgi:hypothetical protein